MPRPDADDLAKRFNPRAEPEREGLPRSYRMRADAHYVDQLESPPQAVIRLLGAAQIECSDLPTADTVLALTKSIALHGVLQPLMVRKHGARYSLIAGRKRLAAAIAAGVPSIPCLIHEVDAAAAAAMTTAENIRVDDGVEREQQHVLLQPLLDALAADLSAILTATALLGNRGVGALPQQVGAGLIETQASRAAWIVASMRGTFRGTRELPLAAIIQAVSDGFAIHATITGLEVECTVTPEAAVRLLPEAPVTAALNGALFATLTSLEGIARPRVEIHADAPQGRTLKIEVVQRSVRVAPGLGGPFAAEDDMQASELVPALALRLAKQVAAEHGGDADFMPLPGRGSVLQMTFPLP